MASRKRTLLKVIILGDSGCVPAAIPPRSRAPRLAPFYFLLRVQDLVLRAIGGGGPARGLGIAPASRRDSRWDGNPQLWWTRRTNPRAPERDHAARRPTNAPSSTPALDSRPFFFRCNNAPGPLTRPPADPRDAASARRA